MQIIPGIEEFHDDLVNWRHDIHAHPELGFEERPTSDLVAESSPASAARCIAASAGRVSSAC